MIESKCGVCNHSVPIDHAQVGRWEADDTLTSYHIGCEYQAAKLKPCQDCGHHRALCDECREI